MKLDADKGIFRQISRVRLSKHIRELGLVYDSKSIPVAVLDTSGFSIYSNPAARAAWGSTIYSKGIGAVCAEPWDIIVEELWKDGLPREICLIGKAAYRKAVLTPMIMGGVRLIAFKTIQPLGSASVTIPYSIDPMAEWARVEEEIPLEESMADLYSLKGKIPDGKFDTINTLYKNIIRNRAGFGTLSTVYRNYGGKREKAVDVISIIKRIGKETGVIDRIIAPTITNYCIGLNADEGVVALAVAECLRWLVPYMKRIGDDERITVKLFPYMGRMKIRFSITRTDNPPEIIKSNSGKYYFEGLQYIAGVIKTFGGELESGVSISEMYLLWDVPFVKTPFENAMSEINDTFGDAVISDAINGIVYALRLNSER
jgi:hypothetical protein